MPFLLFLLSVATLVAVSSKSKEGSGGRTQTFTLDANMPERSRNQVLAALVSGTDPATLDAFATAIQAQYPLSAGLLHAKARRFGAGALGAGRRRSPRRRTIRAGRRSIASMPPALVAFVHTELANEIGPDEAPRAREHNRRAVPDRGEPAHAACGRPERAADAAAAPVITRPASPAAGVTRGRQSLLRLR